MQRYLRDEREIINAYKDAETGFMYDESIFQPIYNCMDRLSPKAKKLVPRYCVAGVLFLMAVSFFSTAMTYVAKANTN